MKVLILGSCVTRDAFEFAADYPPLTLHGYYARSALVSATDSRQFDGVPLENIASAFQRRMVERDITGAVLAELAAADFDVIVYDAVDERYPVLVNDAGAYATQSDEFRSSRYDASRDRVVGSFTDEAFALWRHGWIRLLAAVDAVGVRSRLLINRVWWADRVEGGGELPAAQTPQRIGRANEYLARLYGQMEADLDDSQFLDFDEEFVAAGKHKWGVNAFHYPERFYRSLLQQILGRAQVQAPT